MLNTVSQNSIDDQTPSYKWDDEKIISYYKRKAREICSQLEKEDEYRKAVGAGLRLFFTVGDIWIK